MRRLKPRATDALAVTPVLVSDRTAPAILGLEPRVYRELVAHEKIPHAVVGRRIVARLVDVLQALGLDGASSSEHVEPEGPAPEKKRNGNRILALIGRERA